MRAKSKPHHHAPIRKRRSVCLILPDKGLSCDVITDYCRCGRVRIMRIVASGAYESTGWRDAELSTSYATTEKERAS